MNSYKFDDISVGLEEHFSVKVDDITPTIQILISKESDYLNGVNITITGGSIF